MPPLHAADSTMCAAVFRHCHTPHRRRFLEREEKENPEQTRERQTESDEGEEIVDPPSC